MYDDRTCIKAALLSAHQPMTMHKYFNFESTCESFVTFIANRSTPKISGKLQKGHNYEVYNMAI